MSEPIMAIECNSGPPARAHPSAKARILVVDDHPLVREGLVRLLSQQEDLLCCGEAGTAPEALAAVMAQTPDLVIMDLRLKGGDGLDLIESLRAEVPALLILILSQYEERLYVEKALRAGARGYLLKEQAAEDVLKAVRTVLAGEVYLTRTMAALLLGQFVGIQGASSAGLEGLTRREFQVFQLLGAGQSTREIAEKLHLSFKTVETHRENIKRKLGLRDATHLVSFATRWARE